jgi:glycosyltransferase involved in cell wall biosynthesis
VLLARRLKLPHVLSVHGGDIYDPSKPYSPHRHPVLHRAVRGVLKGTDAVVCQSENTRRNTKSLYDFDRDIDLVPLAFQPAPFEPANREQLGLKQEGLYAIAVSRLIPRKGYRHLLTALSKANVPGLELIIVGDGPEREALSTLVGQLGIGSRVHFKGQLDEQSKFQYLSASDFFVLASLHEGFGIVFQEAMHCGLPIVTTNEGGQTDFLHHEHNALLCRTENEGALTEYMRRMCEDEALRHRLSENNRREIKAHCPGPIARKYVEIYERTIHTFHSR